MNNAANKLHGFTKTLCIGASALLLIAGASQGSRASVTVGVHAGGAYCVSLSPDGQYLASGGVDKLVKIWKPASKALVKSFKGHTGSVTSVAYSPNGTQLVSGSSDGTVKIWDVASAKMLRSISVGPTITGVAVSPDGLTIASSDYAYNVCLWQFSNGKAIKTLKGHTDRVLTLAFSPNGKTLASGAVDFSIRLWDISGGASKAYCRATLRGHGGEVTSVAFFKDGVLASTSFDRSVRLWDVNSATQMGIGVLPPSWSCLGFHSLSVSPDGGKMATGSDDDYYMVWWTRSGNSVKVYGALSLNGDDTNGMVFSLDSKQLATASSDGTIKTADAFECD